MKLDCRVYAKRGAALLRGLALAAAQRICATCAHSLRVANAKPTPPCSVCICTLKPLFSCHRKAVGLSRARSACLPLTGTVACGIVRPAGACGRSASKRRKALRTLHGRRRPKQAAATADRAAQGV